MSDSENEAEVKNEVIETPKKKQPIDEARRKMLLQNLAKGRATRSANLIKKRDNKEKAELEALKCTYCRQAFKYNASKTKHEKSCKKNPINKVEETTPVVEENKEAVEKVEEKPEVVAEEKPIKLKKKKKVVYKDESSDSDSDDEIIVRRKRKPRGKVVYLDGRDHFSSPPQQQTLPPVRPQAPPKPQLSLEQQQAMLREKQQNEYFMKVGKEQVMKQNKIKELAQNMSKRRGF
jgi:hypothetical protein